MKKFRILLFAMAGTLAFGSFAQTDTDWTQDAAGRLANTYPYLGDYINVATDGMVFAQEFSFANSQDVENKDYHILAEDQTYKLDRTMDNGVFSHFALVVNHDKTTPLEERPELNLEFTSLLTNAYQDTVFYADYHEYLENNVKATYFLSSLVVGALTDLAPMPKAGRGGEYYTSVKNNVGTSRETHLTLTADPACTLGVTENDDWGFMMSTMANINVFIGSGYPYADHLSDYQSGEVKLSVLDANDVEAYSATFPLEASADSLLLEYVINTETEMLVTSPKYTFKLSGPMLTEDIVITREALPDLRALNDAIYEAETLCDSIMNDPELADFVEMATQLKATTEAAKECLTLTAYEQNQIDETACSLKLAIDAVHEALANRDDDVTAIEYLRDASNKVADKRLVNGLLLINHNGITYDARGIR